MFKCQVRAHHFTWRHLAATWSGDESRKSVCSCIDKLCSLEGVCGGGCDVGHGGVNVTRRKW